MIFRNLSRTHFIIQTSSLVFDNEFMINKLGMERSSQIRYNTEEFCIMPIQANKKCNNLVQRIPAYNIQKN